MDIMDDKMDKTLVSVIIATYNRASLLERAIKSVLNQTFKNFELIIVDDGSTDNTCELVNQFIQIDSRVKYIWQENSGGPAKPRNMGIRKAKGEYITILDSDDEILPEKLEKQVNKFQSEPENVGVVYCGIKYVSKNGKCRTKKVIPSLKGNLFVKLLQDSFLGYSTLLIKKECFQKSGLFDNTLPSGEDWDMWIRISKNYEFDYVPEALSIYNIHGKQISADFKDTIEGFKRILDKYKADISRFPSIYSDHLIRIGIFCCINGDLSTGQKYFSESIKIKPYQIKAYLNFIFLKITPGLYKRILVYIFRRFTLTGFFS